ncbi:DUF1840 domain-containing protein [Thiomonas sp. FB-Cd]|uniref:DUF1840 domain-containing protein n=1 Tax=Thiomonas sp. FB-Cd TaxID=1158292 RepID=UPI0004DF44CC|nr:DUF1840 domain-containing protein [Thiomonas sp. FB-Cd]
MLYKFKSQADSDLYMNQAPAERILAIIGKDPAAQGIIEPADMAEAIVKLERAVAEDDAARTASTEPTPDATEHAGPAGGQAITLHQRAWPFIQLLKRSLAADKPIVWGV